MKVSKVLVSPLPAIWSGVLVAAALAIWTTAPVQAEPLRVAVIDLAPYAMSEADGRAFGQYPDLVRQVAAQADVDASIRVVSCARAGELLASGQVDLVLSPESTQLRQFADPLATVATLDTVSVTQAARASAKLDAVTRVGQLRGGCLDNEHGGNRQMVALDSMHDGVRLLAAGSVDSVTMSREAFYHYANLNRLSTERWEAMEPEGQRSVWLYASRKLSADIRGAFLQATEQLKQSGLMRRSMTMAAISAW